MPSLADNRHTFAFRTADGELVFRELSTAEYFALEDYSIVLDDGRRAVRSPDDEYADGGGPNANRDLGYPIHCEALAVHPEQRAEAIERAKRCGVPTDYDPAGRPILTGPGHRRRLLAVEGFFDRRGYD